MNTRDEAENGIVQQQFDWGSYDGWSWLIRATCCMFFLFAQSARVQGRWDGHVVLELEFVAGLGWMPA